MSEAATSALTRLFVGALRQGPGDPAILDRMISALDPPERPRAADLGCGTGAASLQLAERWSADVLALDISQTFIATLMARLDNKRLAGGSVQCAVGDMAAPPASQGSLDLIVAEGSAYAVGFEKALRAWRPLLSGRGGVVVSECVWLGAQRPDAAAYFWNREYPAMGSTAQALATAERTGFRLVASERLPASAWLSSYYAPLANRIASLETAAQSDPALAEAVDAMRREIESFPDWADDVAYVYFALDVEGRPERRSAVRPRARPEDPRGRRLTPEIRAPLPRN